MLYVVIYDQLQLLRSTALNLPSCFFAPAWIDIRREQAEFVYSCSLPLALVCVLCSNFCLMVPLSCTLLGLKESKFDIFSYITYNNSNYTKLISVFDL